MHSNELAYKNGSDVATGETVTTPQLSFFLKLILENSW